LASVGVVHEISPQISKHDTCAANSDFVRRSYCLACNPDQKRRRAAALPGFRLAHPIKMVARMVPATNMSDDLPKGRWLGGYLTAVSALFLCMVEVPNARGDSASCIANASSYVAELDELLSKERNWITPFEDLNKRYFPLRDCEADALLEVVRRSNFIRSISHHSRTNEYLIHFSSDEVSVGFGYLVSEKKSTFDTASWVHK
jgi:hypothetical protein